MRDREKDKARLRERYQTSKIWDYAQDVDKIMLWMEERFVLSAVSKKQKKLENGTRTKRMNKEYVTLNA